MDPTGSVEGWRRDLVHFAYSIKIADNSAHSLVTGDELLLTVD